MTPRHATDYPCGMGEGVMIHAPAEVSPDAVVGEGTRIWNQARVREGARLGRDCIVGTGVYVDTGVQIGDRVKLENGVSLFKGTRLGDGVFIGPHAILLNDKRPRAITPDGALKSEDDWSVSGVTVLDGASV